MYRYLKILIVFVIAAVLTAAFSGCNKNKDDDTSLDELYAAVSSYEDALESAAAEEKKKENSKQNFVIVIPAGCGAELFSGADFLSLELSKYVGYEVRVEYDCEFKKSAGDVEILVGRTDRNESIKYFKRLRVNDYGYSYVGGAVQIGAHSEALCVKAINAFAQALSERKIDLGSLQNIDPYTVYGEYNVDEIKLCGFPIYEYDIVCPESNTMSEKALAEFLRDKLAEYCGYSLRIISDRQCNESTRAICVGKSALTSVSGAEGEALVSVSAGGNIELVSDKNAGIRYAIDRFIELVKQSEQGRKCNVQLEGLKNYSYNGDKISLYIVRDNFADESLDACANAATGAINSGFAVFDGLSQTVKTRLASSLATLDGIEENSFYYADGESLECVYKKSELLSSGGELLTLVMERADGNRFVFIAGFCDGDGNTNNEELLVRLAEECGKYDELPIVVAHELSDTLDRIFDETNARLCAVEGFYGLYFSADSLALKSAAVSEIKEPLYADVLELELYYG